MRKPVFRTMTALLLSLALFFAWSCSQEEEIVAIDNTGPDPLSATCWPSGTGKTWQYVIMETGLGIIESDGSFNSSFYDTTIPAAHAFIQITGETDVEGETGFVYDFIESTEPEGAGEILRRNEVTMVPGSGGLTVHGIEAATSVGEPLLPDEVLPANLLEFGNLTWTLHEESYSIETEGRVEFSDAFGFDYERLIYSGDPENDYIYGISDVDHDTFNDSIMDVRLVSEVLAEVDLVYPMGIMSFFSPLESGFSLRLDQLFSEMPDTTFKDCKWVRQSLEATALLTNQRNPNAPAGTSSIPEFLNPLRMQVKSARRVQRLYLIAPDLGPLVIVDCLDLDKKVMVDDPGVDEVLLQADVQRFHFLSNSSELP